MAGDRMRSVIVGGAIALLVFGTVPLAQLAARHDARPRQPAQQTGRGMVERIGGGVTSFVEINSRVSVALSGRSRPLRARR